MSGAHQSVLPNHASALMTPHTEHLPAGESGRLLVERADCWLSTGGEQPSLWLAHTSVLACFSPHLAVLAGLAAETRSAEFRGLPVFEVYPAAGSASLPLADFGSFLRALYHPAGGLEVSCGTAAWARGGSPRHKLCAHSPRCSRRALPPLSGRTWPVCWPLPTTLVPRACCTAPTPGSVRSCGRRRPRCRASPAKPSSSPRGTAWAARRRCCCRLRCSAWREARAARPSGARGGGPASSLVQPNGQPWRCAQSSMLRAGLHQPCGPPCPSFPSPSGRPCLLLPGVPSSPPTPTHHPPQVRWQAAVQPHPCRL